MRFQTKLIAVYAIFMVVVALVLGFGFHEYSIRQYEKIEEKNLEGAANQLVIQFDETIKTMEMTMNYILSNSNVLSGIHMLARASEKEVELGYIDEAKKNIRTGINTDYITKQFYRTIVFNNIGSVISTYSSKSGIAKTTADFKVMPWLSTAKKGKGKPIIISTHEDAWGVKKGVQVFSLLKAVQGKNMGYIEIQREIKDLEKQLKVSIEGIEFMVFINGDELLYSSTKDDALVQYKALLKEEGAFAKSINIKNKGEQLVVKRFSERYDANILVIQDKKNIKDGNAYITSMTFTIAFAFFAVSMAFIVILSRLLTKPIRQLSTIMEHTKLENLGEEISVNTPNDEIEALSISYQKVLERLKKSIIKEKRMSLLQIQAQFDSLQSQVNPHFLYNVLNVIAARGMSTGDETICEICGSLAMMLRYSTNNKNRYATIREELEYLNQYFYLLESRYAHKIAYKVDVVQSIQEQIIPKIVLQQIVENCINHGFENTTGQMKITVEGWQKEECWYIKVRDNGQGFEEKTLAVLIEKLKSTKERLLHEETNMELEIGGMGLVNTYARLLLLYNDELIFTIQNAEDGAEVIIGAYIRKDR